MQGEQKNISIESGADFVYRFQVYDDNGDPADLTGMTIEAQLREYAEASEAIIFTADYDDTGKITLTLPHELTSQISIFSGVYSCFVEDQDGSRWRVRYGSATIEPNVVRPADGTVLYMIGVGGYEDLPLVGDFDRLYFCYDDRRIYRWNGTNYVATAVGNGIQRIDFVEHTSEFTDTYRIIYDDGTWFDYQVTSKGIMHIRLIGSTGDYLVGTTDTYRITFNNGTYYDYDVHGGRVVFPLFYVDFDTGYLMVTDDFSNVTFSLDEETGVLSYEY